MFKIISAVFICLTFSTRILADQEKPEVLKTIVPFFTEGITLMGKGAIAQFQESNNLYYLAAGAGSLSWAFDNDDRLKNHYGKKTVPKYMDLTGDFGVVLNLPILPFAAYYVGEYTGNKKLSSFAMETFSTLYLALIESGAISFVHVHERPSTEGLSGWEKKFRGDSSFPSGHVIPYMTVFFKTFQYYGPWASLPPLALSFIASKQRIRDNKHYTSDVVGSFFLTAFASEGVRRAYKSKYNHPVYKMIFEHDMEVGIIRYEDKIGPKVSFTF